MWRPLSRKQHGFADYAFAAIELALPRVVETSARARWPLTISGANALLLGLLTKHELGLVKLVPMRVHLALDGVLAAGALAAPALLPDGRGVKGAIVALGASGGAVTALTDPDD